MRSRNPTKLLCPSPKTIFARKIIRLTGGSSPLEEIDQSHHQNARRTEGQKARMSETLVNPVTASTPTAPYRTIPHYTALFRDHSFVTDGTPFNSGFPLRNYLVEVEWRLSRCFFVEGAGGFYHCKHCPTRILSVSPQKRGWRSKQVKRYPPLCLNAEHLCLISCEMRPAIF